MGKHRKNTKELMVINNKAHPVNDANKQNETTLTDDIKQKNIIPDDIPLNIRTYENSNLVPSWITEESNKTKISFHSSTRDESSDTDTQELTINEKYASEYTTNKQQLELSLKHARQQQSASLAQRVRDALQSDLYKNDQLINNDNDKNSSHGSDSNSSDVGSDGDSDLTESSGSDIESIEFDPTVFDIINKIRNKDSTIYNDKIKFYASDDDSNNNNTTNHHSIKQSSSNKQTELQQHILDSLQHADVSTDDELDVPAPTSKHSMIEQSNTAKKAFVNAAALSGDSDSDDNIFIVRPQSNNANNNNDSHDNKPVVDTSQFNDTNDRYLADYLINEWWKSTRSTDTDNNIPLVLSPSNPNLQQPELDDELQLDDKVDSFETKYNFRYEQPGSAHIYSFGRHGIDTSMRKPDSNKRTQQREQAKINKQLEKQRIADEVRKLKNMKKQQLQSQLDTLFKNSGGIQFTVDDIMNEFNESQYESRMNELYNDEYYNESNVHDTDESIQQMLADDAADTYDYDSMYVNDTTGDNNIVLDPHIKSQAKQLVEQHQNELLSLDYEDVIAQGTIKTRFKYADVKPDTMGIDLLDILSKPDNQLNQICGMKKYATYRDTYDIGPDQPVVPKWKRFATESRSYHNTSSNHSKQLTGIQPKHYKTFNKNNPSTHQQPSKKQQQQQHKSTDNITTAATGTTNQVPSLVSGDKLSASAKRRLRKRKLQSTNTDNDASKKQAVQ